MKKLLFLLVALFIHLNNVAQDYPRVEKITTDEKILHGYIAGKYPITLYLKVHKLSGFHTKINKLKGWYYYDNIKTKIPLVGISGQELILYQLKDEESFFNRDLDSWNDFEELGNISEYIEKFVISNKGSKWLSKDKELKLSINVDNTWMIEENEYLRFSEKRVFDLNQFIAKEFSLLYANQNRFILNYSYNSKANVMGHCGAGNEEGYLLLVFNEKNELKKFEEFPTESCLDGIYAKQLKSNNNDEIIYEVFVGIDEVSHKLIINRESINIKKRVQ